MNAGDWDAAVWLFGRVADLTQKDVNFIINSEEIDEIQKQMRIIQEIFPLTATEVINILNNVRSRQV